MLDARRTLDDLNNEWSSCTACTLGTRRASVDGSFVAGEGLPRGVMFIGEGPGEKEEMLGRPFVGPSGILLRKVIKKLGLEHYYITNIVTCRSCSPVVDALGMPRIRKQKFSSGPGLPIMKDEPPLPVYMATCSPRLYEEIYLVDPIIIVTLGVTASEFILKRPVAITKDRGQTEHAYIPGATHRAVLTNKKGAWARKIKGSLEMPVTQNEVMYEVMPTLHPAFVIRKLNDKGWDSPIRLFGNDIRRAVKIYERYMLEAFGTLPSGGSDIPDEVFETYEEEDQ